MNTILSDLDDFITPSQECVKMIVPQQTGKAVIDDADDFQVTINEPGQKRPDLIKGQENSVTGATTAKISLQDCLACSGCITSAETVLIQQHSVEEFMNLFKDGNQVIVGVSPQSLASLAAFFGIASTTEVFLRLKTVFQKLGAVDLLNLDAFSQLSLELAYVEFKERFTNSAKTDQAKLQAVKKSVRWNSEIGNLPLLVSECPAWVSYAEKMTGEEVFPFMSQVKSPQQLFAKLIKYKAFQAAQVPLTQDAASKVKVVCIMPCFDKKLEATRPTLSLGKGQIVVPEVDTVLATHELFTLFKDHQIADLKAVDAALVTPAVAGSMVDRIIEAAKGGMKLAELQAMANRSSNGYLEYVYRRAASELFGVPIDPSTQLEYVQGRNKDLREVTFKSPDGRVSLKFAQAYGFRNIQNVIRKIKQGKCDYDYVELMACPKGCVNGGGQVKTEHYAVKVENQDLVQQVEQILHTPEEAAVLGFEQDSVFEVIKDVSSLEANLGVDLDKKWFQAKFIAIPKDTVSVANLKW